MTAGGATNSGGTASKGGSTGAGTGGSVGTGGTSSVLNTGGTGAGKPTGGGGTVGGSPGTTGGKNGTGGSSIAGTGGAATGGQSNSTGGLGTGGLWRGPTPPTSTAKFPFPQNRESPNCIYPTAYSNLDVQAAYTAWKKDLVVTDSAGVSRVVRPNEPGTLQKGSTVSEGIGYGMIIAVYMNDQTLFDGLWRFALAHTWGSPNGSTLLMNWYIAADGSVASPSDGGSDGSGAATDADEDIAWALIMADRQWGGKGSLTDKTYLAYAQQLAADIWTWETINYNLPKNGSSWGDDNCLNISYFAPAYYRVFASVGGNSQWLNNAVPYIYQVISQSLNSTNGNQNNGLVPGFSTSMGAAANCGPYSSPQPHNYQYDACRTPFRIGLDACWNNDPSAVGYVGKTSSFFTARGGASKIADGYGLDGTPQPQNAAGTYYPQNPGGTLNGLSAAFIGPAAVGAMHTQAGQNYQTFLNDAYNLVRQNNLWCGGQYYDESWTMLSLLMMTGNFLDYTKY
jgi:endo-1,4-beta-D-glucanase Y